MLKIKYKITRKLNIRRVKPVFLFDLGEQNITNYKILINNLKQEHNNEKNNNYYSNF